MSWRPSLNKQVSFMRYKLHSNWVDGRIARNCGVEIIHHCHREETDKNKDGKPKFLASTMAFISWQKPQAGRKIRLSIFIFISYLRKDGKVFLRLLLHLYFLIWFSLIQFIILNLVFNVSSTFWHIGKEN